MSFERGSVGLRAISGPPSRQTANRHRPVGPLHYRTDGPSKTLLHNAARAIFGPPGIMVFANEKAWPVCLYILFVCQYVLPVGLSSNCCPFVSIFPTLVMLEPLVCA